VPRTPQAGEDRPGRGARGTDTAARGPPGAAMLSLVPGSLLQRLLPGDVPAAAYGDGVRALLGSAPAVTAAS
jgi:hypothetical protein